MLIDKPELKLELKLTLLQNGSKVSSSTSKYAWETKTEFSKMPYRIEERWKSRSLFLLRQVISIWLS